MTPRLAKTAARQVAGAKQLDSRCAGVWTAATENSCDERRWNDRRDDCDCDSSGATWRRLSLRVWSRSVKCEQLVNDRPTGYKLFMAHADCRHVPVGIFSRPRLRSRLCYSVASVRPSVCLYIIYCGKTVRPRAKVTIDGL